MFIRQLRFALIPAFGLALAACGEDGSSPPEVQAVPVATVSAEADVGYRASSSYTGRVEARLDSQLGFEIGGLLASVAVEEGAVVGRNEPLAALDTARLAAQRAEARAAFDQVQAELELAEATLERTAEAFDFKGVSRQQLDEAQQRVATLAAATAVAEARLRRISVDIDKATLTAPFAGTVVHRAADPGVVLAPGQTLLSLQSSDQPEARIGIAPEAAGSLAIGESFTLTINDRPVEATLKTIVPRRDEATRTVDAIFRITSPEAILRPGDLARLDTERFVETPGYWIPVSALIEGPRGLWQGLVAEQHGKERVLVKHTVEVLHANDKMAFVRGTLESGDLLVSKGTHRVVAGQKVSLAADSTLARAESQPEDGQQ
ncbi:MAG: efflux RND transporter periplasmic adaptor subunit [Pseudomonadota bacterium]